MSKDRIIWDIVGIKIIIALSILTIIGTTLFTYWIFNMLRRELNRRNHRQYINFRYRDGELGDENDEQDVENDEQDVENENELI